MSKNIKKNLSLLIVLHFSSKAWKKAIAETFKPDKIEAICEFAMNIVNKKN